MINTILSALTVRDIRRKVGFTALILLLYRLGAHLYVPGVNVSAIKNNPSLSGSGIFSFLNLFSGGALSQMAIFALGIMPYITASIILQLLQVGRAVAREAAPGGRGRAGPPDPVHALPDGRPRLRPVDRLRLPVPLDLDRRQRRVDHPRPSTCSTSS